ncbi:hypothetical protein GALMADRAFT_112894 [Galerina marginata CBS 339.88]|uniref:DNA repair protein RAD50 n=1 Tax=Galerina marginata (strain CBS 339.88) TaxID=685588 RepID=A0A067THW4_GALM3|nr:hypothetical protein GALMADRAFT_112894 [Galerina marginata CBS 339.88]
MACLNKLAIRGIRSFDDKQIAVIEFFSPVTVIVGHNGSGKTTIIECLKYATTGDQPPNTRGGAFIHDPKMANEKEVKAQVKLRFHAANGTRMLAVRNLSVTVKKTAGLTMKTLENILALADGNADKGGKRGVISTKCAELDTEIPQLLGVSKAVLENVIFCHQEDSYWPLAEPAALKKKFDDIFEATRYTKALDSIKSLRKDRLADLKAEKERLLSLSREKAHSDKLKERLANHKSVIAAKEVEYEEARQQYDGLVDSNRKFYELFSKFREMYLTVGKLEEGKAQTENYLAEVKSKYQQVLGTLEELQLRADQFEDNINFQKETKLKEERKKDDLEEELSAVLGQQRELLAQRGRLEGEAEEQRKRIAQREQAIHEIGDIYGIKGFSHSPLEREKILEFLSRLGDVQRRQQHEFEKLQSDLKAKNEDYYSKLRALDYELESHKSQKQRLRDQISERQEKIKKTERVLEGQQDLPGKLRSLQGDMEEKKDRLEKLKSTIASANFDVRLAELASKSRILEEERDQLNIELQGLSLQAESRARLELKRGEVKTKSLEIENSLDITNSKFKALTGRDIDVSTIEASVEKLFFDKEKEQSKVVGESKVANGKLQKADLDLSHLKNQLKQKRAELKGMENKLKDGIAQHASLDDAIKIAADEVEMRRGWTGKSLGTSSVYESLLKEGKRKKVCGACNRHLNNEDLVVFEKQMKDFMKKDSPEHIAELQEELKEWQEELDTLHSLRPVQNSRNEMKAKEIPELEKEISTLESAHPELSRTAEEIGDKLEEINRQVKEVLILKQQAITISRLQKEVERAKQEVDQLELSLSSTGSTKTADDVQNELSRITGDIRKNERESKAISGESDRQSRLCRDIENSLHSMQLEERDFLSKIQEKDRLDEEIERMKREIGTYVTQAKDIDTKISEAQAPIVALQESHQRVQRDLNSKISEAQRLFEDLNKSMDRLNDMNKNVERYVKEKKARALEDCSSRLEQCDVQLQDLQGQIEGSRDVIASIDKEINESGATISNLRDNIIVQKLTKDIAKTQAEIDSYDMEEAARARRNYEDKYEPSKRREEKLGEVYHQLTGELGSLKAQLKSLETDLKEFKDVYKKYTDQLIRVKVSDMANSDLEKYAKALDNAIMKYHGLKMEEVNDTMKHLWNKTYQGTDIDGIKIRSDVEGGASKRSYNYRVVMTKDQVEMDMRGRCSAGQKMLASIIIRLALSDSFGQNCGILALDEPTNALDTENIDALAASLVDIINERKSHSNFQLIIITHDENFLRKLGQSDVMEYYWRVSRDSRQKSVIERQRFR